jgi:hypothetical protein
MTVRRVDAEPALVAVEFTADLGRQRLPVAVEHLRPEEVLQFKIALLLDDPVAVLAQS